jgi:hypothetical protein
MNFSVSEFLVTQQAFDPVNDKIAIVIDEFELKKNPDWPLRYSEPYIVSMAIDQNGANNPAIDFNILPFPKVKKGDVVDFGGQGYLVYGPANPGEFVAYSILYMESDSDMRSLGQAIQEIIQSEAAKSGAAAVLAANPGFATAGRVLGDLALIIADRLKKNKDDELFRQNGTLLRGTDVPYDIKVPFESSNSFIRSKISVIPLSHNLTAAKDTGEIKL